MQENRSRWFALMIVLTAPLLSVIDVFIINIAIPAIKQGVHASEAEVQLVIASYLLGYAAFLITGGRFGDHFGKKRVFVWGMIFFTLTSCWCGFSHSAVELNVARFFQGTSAAFMFPQTISYIQVLFTGPKDRTRAVGYFGLTLGIASMLGQFLGGYLTYFHVFIPGWRLIFFINLPIGAVAVAMAVIYLRETATDVSRKFDTGGIFLLTFALMSLILPLVQGREYGWPWWSWCSFAVSIVLFLWFFRNQQNKRKRGEEPLINVSLFSFKDFNIGLMAVFCLFVVHNSYLLISTLLFQNGFRMNAFLTGKLFVLFGTGFLVSSLYSIKLITRYGKTVVLGGVAILIASLSLQIYFFGQGPAPIPLIGCLLVLHGLGSGILIPSVLNLTLKSVPTEFAGAASGLYSTFQQTSSALGVSLIGGLFFSALNSKSDLLHYQTAFRYGGIAELLTLVVLGFLISRLPDHKQGGVHLGE